MAQLSVLVRSAVVLVVVLLALPVVGFVGFGLIKGYDVPRGLVNVMWDSSVDTVEVPPFSRMAAQVTWLSDIQDYEIAESSGLAASLLHDDILWTINDSGSEPYLYAVDLAGHTQAKVLVDTSYNVDWESLSSFSLDGKSFLAIGDTGDNFRWHANARILIVPEPLDLTAQQAAVAWSVAFTYPDTPRDSEAMAVAPQQGKILVLSKREYPVRLFELPLQPATQEIQIAREVGQLFLPQPTPLDLERDADAKYRHMPSGMDIRESQRGGCCELFITTYQHAYLLPLQIDQDSAISGAARQVLLPSLGQREALAFSRDDKNLAYISKERYQLKGFADLFAIQLAND